MLSLDKKFKKLNLLYQAFANVGDSMVSSNIAGTVLELPLATTGHKKSFMEVACVGPKTVFVVIYNVGIALSIKTVINSLKVCKDVQ